jgi:hypothetical protein
MELEELTFDSRDEFNRRTVAEKVINLLVSDLDVSPMIIDGDWGTGKTEFCHKLINLMASNHPEHQIIYVDAYKADHADDPLLTIIAEILKIIPKGLQQKSFVKKIIPTLRYGFKAGAKAGVSHLLRQDFADVADDYDKEIKQASDKLIDASVESLLKDHVEANKNLRTLQASLTQLAKEKPITIFIDELDRCRPNFSVAILETIKHVFDVENVKFVLITNRNQLRASINHCYGVTIDAHRYLDKFLKFNFTLSKTINTDGQQLAEASVTHYRNLIRQSPTLENAKLDQDAALNLVGHVIKEQNLSLREVETLVRHIEIYQVLTEHKGFPKDLTLGYQLIRIIGVILFCFKPELAQAILNNQADAKLLGAFLGNEGIMPFEDEDPYPEHYQVLSVILGQECRFNSELFTPTEGKNKDHWAGLIREYSGYRGFPSERSRIIIDVINVLNFNI